ncbi:uncharacterized protein EV154DRAFT_502697 [Mucor mucedo]|uniref:uncharacterized protein n=1 Tax=Mucor mucedo TaxID=29922 RepID=UPI00221EFD33|nr:uncharacterized protein EV154DRAFT_502697 [Mucor mucedo]KAI7893175.1 hypothetical protein EV154DRAFT_502697 [Mucor mucedo]
MNPGYSESTSHKRQKTNEQPATAMDANDFLNFDYEFPMVNGQGETTTAAGTGTRIPEDFFMFVTDNSPNATIVNTPSPKAIKKMEPPNQAVYTIVVGGKPFRLSWESLKSDGPTNFFLEYFRKKKTSKVMHIDRDTDVFELIVRHLRGYYIRPIDDIQNQSLLYDANYFGLNRLKKMLQEYLFLNVGGRVFRLPWTLFQKDGTHNFFTGPLMHSLLSPHTEDGNSPPIYIDRDPDIFADIVNHLRGYTIHIRDEMHRKNLLKDAQYYVFRQLSDKLLTAQQTVAGFGDGSNPEVLLLLQDIRLVNMIRPDMSDNPSSSSANGWTATQVQYKRIVEGTPHALLVQVSDLCIQIHKSETITKLSYEMNPSDLKKMVSMAKAIKATGGMNMELFLDTYCAITIDDNQVKSIGYCLENDIIETQWEACTKCKQDCQMSKLILQRAICGVHLMDNMMTLCALRLEAISSRFRLNLKRQFLSG